MKITRKSWHPAEIQHLLEMAEGKKRLSSRAINEIRGHLTALGFPVRTNKAYSCEVSRQRKQAKIAAVFQTLEQPPVQPDPTGPVVPSDPSIQPVGPVVVPLAAEVRRLVQALVPMIVGAVTPAVVRVVRADLSRTFQEQLEIDLTVTSGPARFEAVLDVGGTSVDIGGMLTVQDVQVMDDLNTILKRPHTADVKATLESELYRRRKDLALSWWPDGDPAPPASETVLVSFKVT